tara:strand:- start:23 stop:433 length:411 start_codon:yes stop_codon:yes gene_type:complete
MTYIKKQKNKVSPFDVAKITGTTNPTFNTFNVDWITLNTNDLDASDGNYYSEAAFSPNSNAYGLSRVHYDGNSTNYHLMGMNIPESNNTSAGGLQRGDDTAIYYGSSHYPKYQGYGAMSVAQDVDRANLKIIRITL